MMVHRISQYARKIGSAFEKLFQSILLPIFEYLFLFLFELLAITVAIVQLTPYAIRKLFEYLRERLGNAYPRDKERDPFQD